MKAKLVQHTLNEFQQGGEPYDKMGIGSNTIKKWAVIAIWYDDGKMEWDGIAPFFGEGDLLTRPEAEKIAKEFNDKVNDSVNPWDERAKIIDEKEYKKLLAEENEN